MEPPLPIELLKQAPSLVAVIIVVLIFINFIRASQKEVLIFFTELQREHIDARELSRRAIEKNSEAVTKNIIVTEQNTKTLDDLRKALYDAKLKGKL